MNPTNLYKRLYQWWEKNHRILPWRETTDAYAIWLSEVILQQTRVVQGLEYYMRFINRWPTVQDLAQATEDEVLREWQGLGYYSRARNLHKAAQQIAATGGFPDSDGDMSGIWDFLHSLPGIGDYTAGAIAAFAYNLAYPALDGNVYRVLARLFDCEIAFDTTIGKKHFHTLACNLLDQSNPRLFNSAIMEFGALHCTPLSPDCEHCVLREFCMAHEHGTVALLPVRKPRPTLRERYLNYRVYLTTASDPELLIHQREGKDIWQHLWEFPLEECDQLIEDKNAIRTMDFTHILSHQRIHARFLIYIVRELPNLPGEKRVNRSQLDDYALSRLTLRALEKLF